jgi:TRAP-type C4-dicarboxylate transport system substrate-binding protein
VRVRKEWRGAIVGFLIGVVSATPALAHITLKVNESLGPGSPEETALNAFKKAVEDGSKGEIKIVIHLQDALDNPQTSMENLITGSLELYSGALEYYEPQTKEELSVVSLPYFLVDHASEPCRGT